MHDSSLERVDLSENITFYMTTLFAANENIKHRNVAFHIQISIFLPPKLMITTKIYIFKN